MVLTKVQKLAITVRNLEKMAITVRNLEKIQNEIVDLFQRLHMTEQRYCANPWTVTLTKCTQVASAVRPPFCSRFPFLQGETTLGLIIWVWV